MIIYFLLYLFALSFFENADQLVFITFYTNEFLDEEGFTNNIHGPKKACWAFQEQRRGPVVQW